MFKLILLFLLLFLLGNASAQTPVLVKDINPGTGTGFPTVNQFPVVLNEILYFQGDDGVHGTELWRSDGTEAGTYMVKDIWQAETGSAPIRLTVLDDKIMFFANDGTHGDELWVSDGTEAGTMLVKDINPGAGNVIRRNYLPQVRDYKVYDGAFFFAADTGPQYAQLWRSDGTEAGTVLVKNVCSGCNANSFSTGEFTILNDTLFLISIIKDMWRSDGTPNGTTQVQGPFATNWPNFPEYLTAANGMLYMSAGDDVFSPDLWISDGTEAGTREVVDFTDSGTPHQFTTFAGKVYFISDDNLWSTDGTEAGTQIESSLVVEIPTLRRSVLFVWKNALYYLAQAADGKVYLYKTDGTANGEEQVSLQKGFAPFFQAPLYFAETEDYLYYNADSLGTTLVRGIARVDSVGNVKMFPVGGDARYLFIAGNNLFFRASLSASGGELWKLPLTTSSTQHSIAQLPLRLYPTLSSDGTFYFDYSGDKSETFDIAVFDALGSMSYQVKQTLDTPLRLPSLLFSGTYVVRITAKDGRYAAQKIVIGQ